MNTNHSKIMGKNVARESTRCTTFPWSELPVDMKHEILSHLPLRNLIQAQCVCRDWHFMVHSHDLTAMHRSEPPSPSICYMDVSPQRIQWSTFDYAKSGWRKMTSLYLDANHGLPNESLYGEDYMVYPVGGLLCFHWKKLGTWVVWNPLTNKWKKLPFCEYRSNSKGETPLVHAFEGGVSSSPRFSYKILLAYEQSTTGRLVMEIFDSSTGNWTKSAPDNNLQSCTLVASSLSRSVLCNGVIYFQFIRTHTLLRPEKVLLGYNIKSMHWHEEPLDCGCNGIFEWDGRVMMVKYVKSSWKETMYRWIIHELDPASRKWLKVRIEIPYWVRREFHRSSNIPPIVEMVASGNYLVVTGLTRFIARNPIQPSFITVVYNKAQMSWSCQLPGGLWFSKSKVSLHYWRLGMLQFRPAFNWEP